MSILKDAILIAWAKEGVKVENVIVTAEKHVLYISVPEHSVNIAADKKEMAGEYLAKRLKETMVEMGNKKLTVKYRIRAGEYWTKEMEKQAGDEMMKRLWRNI